MSIQELKSKRKSSMENLVKKVESLNGGYDDDKEKFWKPSVGKDGNGQFIIRFLPEPEGEESPVVHLWNHFIKGPGGYYVENSRTTLGRGEPDPVSEYNSKLWNMSENDNSPERKQARDQKRRLVYYSNILVVKDPVNPENEGKVFLYQYGKKIHDMIAKKLKPIYDDDEAVNVFDFWEGANFRMRISSIAGDGGRKYWSYDDSTFESPSSVSEDDDELDAIWKTQYSLAEIVSPDKFKSYDELREKFFKVLGTSPTGSLEKPKPRVEAKPVEQKSAPESTYRDSYREKSASEFLDDDIPFDVEPKVSSDDDDDLSVFKSLMDDD
jgi:hypothetical protein